MKLSRAIQRIGDIMKKQDRKFKGMIETSETRLQKQQQLLEKAYSHSPMSNKSSRNNQRVLKSHQSINMSNNSMMRSLSPIKQDDSKLERSFPR